MFVHSSHTRWYYQAEISALYLHLWQNNLVDNAATVDFACFYSVFGCNNPEDLRTKRLTFYISLGLPKTSYNEMFKRQINFKLSFNSNNSTA